MSAPIIDLGHCLNTRECYCTRPEDADIFKPGAGATTFFDLPRELRDMIYDFATLDVEVRPMSKTKSQHVGHPNRFNAMNTGLLLTSKEVRLEVLEQKVYFMNTIFTFDLCQVAKNWIRKVPASYRPQLRRFRYAPISTALLEQVNESKEEINHKYLSWHSHSGTAVYYLQSDLWEEFSASIGQLEVKEQCFNLEDTDGPQQRITAHWRGNDWTVAKQAKLYAAS